MAKLVVPPPDTRLAEIFESVLTSKSLLDDELWTKECLPLLHLRLDQLYNLVKEAQMANAHTPDTHIVEAIFATIDRVKTHLNKQFSSGAPFTIHRLGELLVDYKSSGYLLTSVVQAQKYILALSRTLMVLLKETDYKEPTLLPDHSGYGMYSGYTDYSEITDVDTKNGTMNGNNKSPNLKRLREEVASAQDYEEHDLPPNVRFVTLPWVKTSLSSNVQDFDVESSVSGVETEPYVHSPSQKRQKSDGDAISPEKAKFQLLSPLHMDNKLDDLELLPGCCEEKPLDYKVDHSERFSKEVLF